MEKQFRKLENRLEADYATLWVENKELVERQRQDKWTMLSRRAIYSIYYIGYSTSYLR